MPARWPTSSHKCKDGTARPVETQNIKTLLPYISAQKVGRLPDNSRVMLSVIAVHNVIAVLDGE